MRPTAGPAPRIWRRRLGWAGCVAAFLALIPCAGAQPEEGDGLLAKPPETAVNKNNNPNIDFVEWGWGRMDEGIPAETFAPVTVWISSGEKPWSGVLRLRYTQDRTQEALIEVPVSTTPSRSIPIELTVSLPNQCESATVELIGGSKRDRRSYATFASPTQIGMPAAASGASRILVVGDSSARALRSRLTVEELESESGVVAPEPPPYQPWNPQAVPTEPTVAFWKNAISATVRPERLPMAWAAYEGLALVILAPDAWDAMDPRARQALQTWVWSGGRVLIEVAGAGNTWANVFPEWSGETPVALNTQSKISIPARLMDLPESLAPPPPSQRPKDASSPPVLARRIELTPRGVADGWKVVWPASDDPTSGVLAFGPAGFGMVGVLSVDPARVIGVLDTPRTRRLWQEAAFEIAFVRSQLMDAWGWYNIASAPDYSSSQGLTASLDTTARREPIGAAVFFVLVMGVGVLALLIGPVDAIVLKRMRKSHLSWATALMWTALACGFAIAAPQVIRPGGSQYGRVRLIDTLAIDPPVSASTIASGVYGASPGTITLIDDGPGTFMRGVSALQSWNNSSPTFAPLRLAQRSSLADPSLRESVASNVTLAQWTFRTLLAQTPAQPVPTAISARLEGDADECTVVLLNVPINAIIDSAWMRVGEKTFALTFAPSEPSPAGTIGTRRGTAKLWMLFTAAETGGLVTMKPNVFPNEQAGSAEFLPSFTMMGPSQRADAVVHRHNGDWAVVALGLSNAMPPTPNQRGIEYFEHTMHRIVVPLPRGFTTSITDGETP